MNPETLWIEPDAYLRYFPVIRWIQKQKGPMQILEVGSGNFGISTYLKYPITKLDLGFTKPRSSSPATYVSGNATRLPFQTGSFDLVFAMDLLEHVPKENRPVVIEEMARVARKQVFAVFPCGEISQRQDLLIASRFEKKSGSELSILKIHENIPFPDEKEIRFWIQPLSDKIRKWEIPNLT